MEKVDLFFGIMVALILSLIPAALLLRDQLERRRKTGKRVKMLNIIYNSVYWLAVVLFVLLAGREFFGYLDKKGAKEHSQKVESANTADHDTLKKDADTLKSSLKIIPSKIQSSTDTILRSLKSRKVPSRSRAFLRFAPNSYSIPHSAIIKSTAVKDSFALSIWVANTGGYTAINLSDTMFELNFAGDYIYLASGALSVFLPDQEIHSNEAYSLFYSMKSDRRRLGDSAVLFLKIHYIDSLGTKGVVRGMLRIYPFEPDVDLPSPIPYDYNKVRSYLIANKIW
jgi:hypothetical protein